MTYKEEVIVRDRQMQMIYDEMMLMKKSLAFISSQIGENRKFTTDEVVAAIIKTAKDTKEEY